MKFTIEIRLLRKKLATLERRKERMKVSRRGKRDRTVASINDQIFGVSDMVDELRAVIATLESMQPGRDVTK